MSSFGASGWHSDDFLFYFSLVKNSKNTYLILSYNKYKKSVEWLVGIGFFAEEREGKKR